MRSAVDTLVRAFLSDPLWQYLFPRPDLRERSLKYLFHFLVNYTLCHGVVKTFPEYQGVALWLPGEFARPRLFNSLSVGGFALLRLGLKSLARLSKVERRQHRVHTGIITRPHTYLALLGIAPEHQTRGLGTLLIRQGLEESGRINRPVYLETANPENVRFYQRLGFQPVKTVRLPRTPVSFTALLYPSSDC